MESFRKYPSIDNHYREKEIQYWIQHHPEIETVKYVLQEKIHGSNFQILITKDKVQYFSRNRELAPDESFYDYQSVMEKYLPTFKVIQEESLTNTIESIRIYGELFGSNIQKGVDYGIEKQFRVFDICINDEFEPYLAVSCMMEDLLFNEFDFVPIIGYADSLQEAVDFEVEGVDSKVLGIENNNIEGIVIKPYDTCFLNQDGSPFYLKKKASKFMEKQKAKKIKIDNKSEAVVKMQEVFGNYINDNRIQSYFSKVGEIESDKQIGLYIKGIFEDAKIDFLKDHLESFNLIPSKEKSQVLGIAGKLIVPLLRNYL